MKTAITVLGTRPEITKLSPLIPLLDQRFRHLLVHTGQHYDARLDRVFFRDLRLRRPDFSLHVGSGTHAAQTAAMLLGLERFFLRKKPDFIVVQGDTNSAMAGALVAAKLKIPIVHVEAGCRSFNRNAPEEVNRIIIDHLADVLCAPDAVGMANLKREGLSKRVLRETGNTSLDCVRRILPFLHPKRLRNFGVEPEAFALATLHRAENTDDPTVLKGLIEAFQEIAEKTPLVFPLHPRTEKIIQANRIRLSPKILTTPPLGYIDFMCLMANCNFILTDSGGIQEEAAALNRPCIIMREQTEWTRLVKAKKNFLVGTDPKKIISLASIWIREPSKLEQIRKRKAPLRFGADKKILSVILRRFPNVSG